MNDFLLITSSILEKNIYIDFFFDFFLNIITVTILCYGLYYKRYHNKESFTFYMLFNVFIFTVITVLFSSSDKMSVGFGFGLFAILSIITLRSEALAKKEIAYFFGALSIAIINAIGLNDYLLLVLANVLILLGAWIIDNPNILKGVSGMEMVLDYIPEGIFGQSESVKNDLSKKLGVTVISYSVINLDYVKDLTKIKISYRISL